MANSPNKKPKSPRNSTPAPNRRRCREYAVQVLFCEFYNSGHLIRAIASVRATTINHELSETRARLRELSRDSKAAADGIDDTLTTLFEVSSTGELPKAKSGASYTDSETEDILGTFTGTLKESTRLLSQVTEKLKEVSGYFGPESFTIQLLQKFHLHQVHVKDVVSETLRNWRSERLTYEDWAILHLGATELLHFPEIPPAVVINEYIEIAKAFGGDAESGSFINGMLDQIRRDHTRKD